MKHKKHHNIYNLTDYLSKYMMINKKVFFLNFPFKI